MEGYTHAPYNLLTLTHPLDSPIVGCVPYPMCMNMHFYIESTINVMHPDQKQLLTKVADRLWMVEVPALAHFGVLQAVDTINAEVRRVLCVVVAFLGRCASVVNLKEEIWFELFMNYNLAEAKFALI